MQKVYGHISDTLLDIAFSEPQAKYESTKSIIDLFNYKTIELSGFSSAYGNSDDSVIETEIQETLSAAMKAGFTLGEQVDDMMGYISEHTDPPPPYVTSLVYDSECTVTSLYNPGHTTVPVHQQDSLLLQTANTVQPEDAVAGVSLYNPGHTTVPVHQQDSLLLLQTANTVQPEDAVAGASLYNPGHTTVPVHQQDSLLLLQTANTVQQPADAVAGGYVEPLSYTTNQVVNAERENVSLSCSVCDSSTSSRDNGYIEMSPIQQHHTQDTTGDAEPYYQCNSQGYVANN